MSIDKSPTYLCVLPYGSIQYCLSTINLFLRNVKSFSSNILKSLISHIVDIFLYNFDLLSTHILLKITILKMPTFMY